MKTLHFTRHVLQRMRSRGISEADVTAVVRNPDELSTYKLDPTVINAHKRIRGEVILVSYRVEASKIVIVTTFKKGR